MIRPDSQNARVLAVLADGRPHTAAEIHQRAGFMRLNSRVAELRAKEGLDISCTQTGPAGPEHFVYQLHTPLQEPGSSAAVADTALTADETEQTLGSGTAVLSETVGERQGWRPGSWSGEQLTLDEAAA